MCGLAGWGRGGSRISQPSLCLDRAAPSPFWTRDKTVHLECLFSENGFKLVVGTSVSGVFHWTNHICGLSVGLWGRTGLRTDLRWHSVHKTSFTLP